MILGDKISELRKKNGWSQEELAERLGVSRQAVSKWESSASMPDVDKIVKLSQVFAVSTDYLLNEDIVTEISPEQLPEIIPAGRPVPVSLELANRFIDTVLEEAGRLAAGVSLCILSPILLILLCGMSEQSGTSLPSVSPMAAVGIGLVLLILLVAVAVGLFVQHEQRMEEYEFFEEEPVELAYGVKGVVEKRRQENGWVNQWSTAGSSLCVLSVLPLMVAIGFYSDKSMAISVAVGLLLAIVACGAYMLVKSCSVKDAFQQLLEQGDYSRDRKSATKSVANIMGIYWCLVTAVYLAWSFMSYDWGKTWIIWPIAGILSMVVDSIAKTLKKVLHSGRK